MRSVSSPASPARYALEQIFHGLMGRVPTVVGVGLPAVLCGLIVRIDGRAAIEAGLRLRCTPRTVGRSPEPTAASETASFPRALRER